MINGGFIDVLLTEQALGGSRYLLKTAYLVRR